MRKLLRTTKSRRLWHWSAGNERPAKVQFPHDMMHARFHVVSSCMWQLLHLMSSTSLFQTQTHLQVWSPMDLLILQFFNEATADNTFDKLDVKLKVYDIKRSNCIAFSSNNASVGKNNSTYTIISMLYYHVYPLGCACHLAHLCASRAAQQVSMHVETRLASSQWTCAWRHAFPFLFTTRTIWSSNPTKGPMGESVEKSLSGVSK